MNSSSSNQSNLQAHLLVYCFLTGVLVCIIGIILGEFGYLPTHIANIAIGVGVLIPIISTAWSLITKISPGISLQNIKLRRVILGSMFTAIILMIPFSWIPISQFTSSIFTHTNTAITTSVIAANPYPSYLPSNGKLVLYDPLKDNSYGNSWDEYEHCTFTNDSYHAITPKDEAYECNATNTDYSNLVLEIQMKIVKGDCGEIYFRSDPMHAKEYDFSLCQDGSYALYRSNGPNTTDTILLEQSSQTINAGLNHTNLVDIIIKAQKFDIYVNQKHVNTIKDSQYNHGEIGVGAFSFDDNPTEVVFRNARVWTIQ